MELAASSLDREPMSVVLHWAIEINVHWWSKWTSSLSFVRKSGVFLCQASVIMWHFSESWSKYHSSSFGRIKCNHPVRTIIPTYWQSIPTDFRSWAGSISVLRLWMASAHANTEGYSRRGPIWHLCDDFQLWRRHREPGSQPVNTHVHLVYTELNVIFSIDRNVACNDAASFCGLKDQLYPDRRAMGFPFDRNYRNASTLADFANLTTNMFVGACNIRFNNVIINRS